MNTNDQTFLDEAASKLTGVLEAVRARYPNASDVVFDEDGVWVAMGATCEIELDSPPLGAGALHALAEMYAPGSAEALRSGVNPVQVRADIAGLRTRISWRRNGGSGQPVMVVRILPPAGGPAGPVVFDGPGTVIGMTVFDR